MRIRMNWWGSLTLVTCLTVSCAADREPDIDQERAAILAVLNGETEAAFTRDYAVWEDHWVQEPYVTKTYINFADSTSSETLGWEDVSDFMRTYIAEHPEPDPLPEPLDDIDLRLYGKGAWVDYQQVDPGRGYKRESRLMEKVGGKWKIAGMQTVIYGSGSQPSTQ